MYDDSLINFRILTNIYQDSIVNSNVWSLNQKQCEAFDIVHKWARDQLKYLSSAVKKQVPPFYLLISGRAGVGKSHLIKTIHMALNKLLLYKSRDSNKPRILLLAATGVAAININGRTIHTALAISIGSKLVPLSDNQKVKLREKL